MVKSGYTAVIVGMIVLTALVSGCSGQSGVTLPVGLFKTDEVSWYQYNLTEEQAGANQTPLLRTRK